MKALQYSAFGGLEVLELVNIAEPAVKSDDVRIKVAAVGLNPMDWLLMENEQLAPMFGIQLPQIFAYDFAGTIDQIGENVTNFKVGDRVFGTTYNGAAAEFITVPATDKLFHTPDELSDEIASTLPVAGGTAQAALHAANITANDTVLIGGAAGGVGVFAVQLANLMGAKVIGTASDSTADFLSNFGAEQVRYGDGLTERLADKNITAAIDLFSHEAVHAALELGVPAEKISTIIGFPEPPAGVTAATGGSATLADMQELLDFIVAGKLQVPIAQIFPLDDYKTAVELQKSRKVHGKLVITM